MFIYDNTSLISSQNEKYFRQNYRENQTTHFIFSIFFAEIRALHETVRKILVQPDGTQMTMKAHALCMPGSYGYRHTLRIFSMYY